MNRHETVMRKNRPVNKIFDTVAAIFTPISPAVTSSGIMKAAITLLVAFDAIDLTDHSYIILKLIADAPLYYLPVLLAYSSAKTFGCNIPSAIAVGGILLHPNFIRLMESGSVSFGGIPIISADYSFSVFPIVLAVWFMSKIEPVADKIKQRALRFFIKPIVSLAVTGFIAIVVIGPAGIYVSDLIAYGIKLLNRSLPWIAPTLVGAFTPALVLTGTHYGLIPIGINNIVSIGMDSFVGPGMLASNMAQAGASFAVSLSSKNRDMKSYSLSSGITALCGITEPAIYGVSLRLKAPLIPVMVAGGVAGLYMGVTGVERYNTATPGIFALPGYLGENGYVNILNTSFSIGVAFFLSFMGTLFIANESVDEGAGKSMSIFSRKKQAKKSLEVINSPLDGEIIPLEKVSDPTFAERILGDGVAIIPSSGKLVSPVSGYVESVADTKHAIIIRSDADVEILIHVGIDTVDLSGVPFKPCVTAGDKISAGETLMEFDLNAIKASGHETTTPIIITNSDEFGEIKILSNVGETNSPLMEVIN